MSGRNEHQERLVQIDHRLRSYHPRRRKLGPDKARDLATHGSRFLRSAISECADVSCGEALWLDVGFGMGESTLDWAAQHPDVRIVGVDVHTPGVANVVSLANARGLANIFVVHRDAWEVIDESEPESIAGVRLLFPDPWPHRRQRSRRLIQPAFVALLAPKLRSGAIVQVATDDRSYAEQIRSAFSKDQGFEPIRPAVRTVTRFELRAIAGGGSIENMGFRYSSKTD